MPRVLTKLRYTKSIVLEKQRDKQSLFPSLSSYPPSVIPVVSSILMLREGGLSVHWCPPWAWLSAPGDETQH